MGISIDIDRKAMRAGEFNTPVPIVLTLTCDGDHGLFPVIQEFRNEEGYMREYQAAMNAGWKDAQRSEGRVFLCPSCSGKQVKP